MLFSVDGERCHLGKRSSDGAVEGVRKRRLVWPGELHHSFVAAVFDMGLRCATACAVARALPGGVNLDAVDYLLSRYRQARRIKSARRTAHRRHDTVSATSVGSTERDEANGYSSAQTAITPADVIRVSNGVSQRSLEIAQRQMAVIAKCEHTLRKFRPRLCALHRELRESLRYDQLNIPSPSRSLPPQVAGALEYRRARIDAMVAQEPHDTTTANHHVLMESQMNLHRQMLVTRAEAQLFDKSHPGDEFRRFVHSLSSQDDLRCTRSSGTTSALEDAGGALVDPVDEHLLANTCDCEPPDLQIVPIL